MFTQGEPLPLLLCETCHATGVVSWRTCPNCHGLSIAYKTRGKLFYWAHPLDRYHLALFYARLLTNKIRKVVVGVLAMTLWLWALFALMMFFKTSPAPMGLTFVQWFQYLPAYIVVLFWLGVMLFSYLVYRIISEKPATQMVEHLGYDSVPKDVSSERLSAWTDTTRVPLKDRVNITESFTPDALKSLGVAYTLADEQMFNKMTVYHILYALLTIPSVRILFIRLGVPVKTLQDKLTPFFAEANSKTGGRETAPVISDGVAQVIFQAYEAGYLARQEYVTPAELLFAVVSSSSSIQDVLYDFALDKDKLENGIEWARIKERLHRQYMQFQVSARHRSKYGMDRAMTAVATPFLNQFSEDVTMLAQFGHTNACIARDVEIQNIFQVVEGGQNSVLLVGDYGVGKKSIVEGIAELMVEDKVPARLADKRMVRLNSSSLLAGTTPAGALERLENIMYEIARAGNVILTIENIQELMGVSAGGGQSLDVAGTMADYLGSGRFLTIATATTEAYTKYIANSKLATVFSRVVIKEMEENQAIQVLEANAGHLEYKHDVFYSYDALAKSAQLAKRFIKDTILPGSAIEIMSEAGSYTRSKKGKDAFVTAEEVGAVIAQKTQIPMTTVTADESTKLMTLETTLHERVIGQDEAVTLVANALRRARAEIRSKSRPISNFLFLGPTGVGKTELAKTIAEVYFGGEDRMVRFDMSEYQDKASLYRLIGAPGEKGTGLLTEAIRRTPFTLLLLDEIEKADRDILNVFLQVMDDGRLTDSTGRVVDFTNVIIIATSNAGTSYVQEQMRAGLSSDIIKDRLLHGELKDYFRPEFLNRFDGIVLFKPLAKSAIKQIASLMLRRVARDLEAKGIGLEVDDAALEFLAGVGFDPEFGARPLRRSLEERVENQLAELLLTGKIGRRDTVHLGAEGVMTVVPR